VISTINTYQGSYSVRDPNVSHFKKTLEKWDTLGKFTQKVLFLDYNTVHDPKLSHFFQNITSKKCDNLGTFTPKVLFLDYNKKKRKKKCHNLGCDNLGPWTVKQKRKKSGTLWGHGLFYTQIYGHFYTRF